MPKLKNKIILFALILFLSFSQNLYATNDKPDISISYPKIKLTANTVSPFLIYGNVIDNNNQGKNNIYILFHDMNTFPGLSSSETTDSSGYYSFSDLDAGKYKLSLIVNNQIYHYPESLVSLTDSNPVAVVDFIIKDSGIPEKKESKPSQGAPIPTNNPTSSPMPSQYPTNNPTATQRPTNQPTSARVPTLTENPTATNMPTDSPTDTPDPTQAPTETPVPSLPLQELINNISESNIRERLENLVDNDDIAGKDERQSRYSYYGAESGNPRGNWQETAYAKSVFDNFGIETSYQNFTFSGKTIRNVIAKIPGENPDDFYLVIAHIDSTAARSGTNNPAPGADDNGSGTSVTIEIARAIKNTGINTKASLEFILFSGEEQGLVGSRFYVDQLPSGKNIKGVINLDMIGNNDGSSGCIELNYKPYNGGDTLGQKIIDVNNEYNIGLKTSLKGSSIPNSDHKPFWDIGVPAVFGFECEFSPVYHTIDDKTDKINYTQLTKIAKAVAGAVIRLANE